MRQVGMIGTTSVYVMMMSRWCEIKCANLTCAKLKFDARERHSCLASSRLQTIPHVPTFLVQSSCARMIRPSIGFRRCKKMVPISMKISFVDTLLCTKDEGTGLPVVDSSSPPETPFVPPLLFFDATINGADLLRLFDVFIEETSKPSIYGIENLFRRFFENYLRDGRFIILYLRIDHFIVCHELEEISFPSWRYGELSPRKLRLIVVSENNTLACYTIRKV